MYDSKIARFLQEDTERGDPNDPLTLNLYAYCHNEPVMYDDPDGHWPNWGGIWGGVKKLVRSNADVALGAAMSVVGSAVSTVKVVTYLAAKGRGETQLANTVWNGMSKFENNMNSYVENKLVANKTAYKVSKTVVDVAQCVSGVAGIATLAVKVTAKVAAKAIAKSVAKEADNLAIAAIGSGGKSTNLISSEVKAVKSLKTIPKIEGNIRGSGNLKKINLQLFAKEGAGNAKYEVGAYKDIKGAEGLDAHHVGQKKAMKDLVKNYDSDTAPAINVPKVGHTISGPNGIVSRNTKGIDNVRQLVARDIKELRRVYDDIPNSALKKVIDLNKKMYPEMNIKVKK